MKKLEEKHQANIAEKERIAREQEELRKLKEREAARPQPDLDSTYNKPGDATFNKTLDRTNNPSSYDITPARHELPTPPPQTEDNYGVADLRSDSDTDDEGNPKKQVPKWAEGTQLRTALLKQCYMGLNTSSEQAVLAGTQRHSLLTSNEFRKKIPLLFSI